MRRSWSTATPRRSRTDYDTSDRLYFEPLTLEDVLEILRVEQENGTLHGVIVQFGGQTPAEAGQGAARRRHPDPRHHARRHRPGRGPRAVPAASAQARPASSRSTASPAAATRPSPSPRRIGYPLVIRPSYVLGGRAMEIVRDDAQLERYIRDAVQVSGDSPVLLDSYLSGAIEVDVDALCDGTRRPRRRHHGAHRGGRRPFRRQRLLPAALLALAPRSSPS